MSDIASDVEVTSVPDDDSVDVNMWEEDDDGIPNGPLAKLFRSNFLSDVTFLVGRDVKHRVPAHKLILSARSWEFHNIFNLLQLDTDEIAIQDVTYRGFLYFLEYCYTGKIAFDEDNYDVEGSFDVLKLAYRFSMRHLKEVFEDILSEKVDSNTCLTWYVQGKFLSLNSKLRCKILETIAWNFIPLITKDHLLKTFLELPLKVLGDIASIEDIECDEMLLFDSFMRWAENQCKKLNIPCTPRRQRLILGDVFYKIRFPTMPIKWILEIQTKYPGLLTPQEICTLNLYIMGETTICPMFPTKKRKFTLDDPKFMEFDRGKLVPTFTNDLKVGQETTANLCVFFNAVTPFACRGFAVIAKRNKYKISSVNVYDNESQRWRNEVDTYSIDKNTLSWDYELVLVFLRRKIRVKSEQRVGLRCTFADEVPLLENFKLKAQDNTFNFVKYKEYAVIPYLIID